MLSRTVEISLSSLRDQWTRHFGLAELLRMQRFMCQGGVSLRAKLRWHAVTPKAPFFLFACPIWRVFYGILMYFANGNPRKLYHVVLRWTRLASCRIVPRCPTMSHVSLKFRHLRFKQHGLSAWTLQRHCRNEPGVQRAWMKETSSKVVDTKHIKAPKYWIWIHCSIVLYSAVYSSWRFGWRCWRCCWRCCWRWWSLHGCPRASLGQMSRLSLRQGFSHRSPRSGDSFNDRFCCRTQSVCGDMWSMPLRFTLVTSV